MRGGRWHLAALPGSASPGPVDLMVRDGVIDSLDACVDPDGCPHADGRVLVGLPLLLNCHDHGRGAGTVATGVPDGPLEEWIDSLQGGDDPQSFLVGAAARAMVASGIGAAVFCVNPQTGDVAREVREACEAVLDSGIRAAVVHPIADTIGHRYGRARDAEGWDADRLAEVFDSVERLAADFPKVEIQLGPVGPQWVSEPTLRAVAEHSARHGRRVHMHLLESPAQRAWADQVYPGGLLEWLAGIGMLNERVWFAHGTQLRPRELALLAEHGCGLSLNASSNLRLASGVAPVADAARVLPRVGLGLDGLALNDDHDHWTELRLARGLWQAREHRAVPGEEILALATRRGLECFGRAAPAVPEVGARADFQLVDVTRWRHLLDRKDWTAADVVTAAVTREEVTEVWIDGEQIRSAR
ncbi:amidohydrolase family protein [Spirillospora sp. CA-255316]